VSTKSNVTNTSFDGSENTEFVGNSTGLIERRNALKVLAGSVVIVAAEVSGAQGALNESFRLDQLSDVQAMVDHAYGLKEIENQKFDVRESYSLIRHVFGGTIGRTADYYGVSRKTIYQWLNSDSVPSLQTRQVDRAMLLESAAKYVHSKLGDKSKEYAKIKINDLSLDELLAAQSIDLEKLRRWVNGIQEQVVSDEKIAISLADKLEERGFSPRSGDNDLDPLI